MKIKVNVLVFLLLVMPFISFSQTDEFAKWPENMASYPGGHEELYKYLSQELQQTASWAKSKGIHGRVIVKFVVEKSGEITEVGIIKSLHSKIDKQVLKVIANMPLWKAPIVNGEPVRSQYSIPLNFD